jgi:hypothetical protein
MRKAIIVSVSADVKICVCGKLREKKQKLQSARILSNMKNGAFWDITPYGSCKNRRFGVT